MKKDKISGIFFLLISLFVIIISLRMSVWANSIPSEGLFPLVLGVLLCFFSIGLLIKTKTAVSKIENCTEHSNADVANLDKRRLYQYIIAIIFYGILMEQGGYILTTGLFLFVILKFVEKKNYLFSVLMSLAVVPISFFVFNNLLGIPLPLGIFKQFMR